MVICDRLDAPTKSMIELLDDTEFYPAVKDAILINLTLPATTCTVKRSFSTLRRVKTWLRNSMTDKRLFALCVLSVHRDSETSRKDDFMSKVIDKFGSDRRRLQLVFHCRDS